MFGTHRAQGVCFRGLLFWARSSRGKGTRLALQPRSAPRAAYTSHKRTELITQRQRLPLTLLLEASGVHPAAVVRAAALQQEL